MNIITPTAAVLTLIVLGLALKKHPLSERNTLLLALFLFAAILWDISLLLLHLPNVTWLYPRLMAHLPTYGILLLALLFFQLTHAFVKRNGSSSLAWLLGFAWIAACALLIENWPALPATWTIATDAASRDAAVILIEGAGWLALSVAGGVLTLRAFYRTPNPLHRNRLNYWTLALTLSVTGSGLYMAGYPGFGVIVYLLAALLAAWIMPSHHLPDARAITRRSLARLSGLLLAVLAYAALLYAALLLLRQLPTTQPILAGSALALILALALNPLLVWSQNKITRRISGSGYDPALALEQYGQQINNILDLQALSAAVMDGIEAIFHPRSAVLFVVSTEGDAEEQLSYWVQPLANLRGACAEGAAFTRGSALMQRMLAPDAPLTQYDIDLLPEFQSVPAAERRWFADLNADVYIPIAAHGSWIGLLALGPKHSGDRYDERDLHFLRTLAGQTGVVLENARLYDDLLIRNIDNERLNRELLTANRELARLDQAKSDFIDIASHELRTPLTQVRGYNDILAEMMAEGDLRPEMGLNLTQNVRKATIKLEEIVDTMFDVSRLDSQTLQLEKYSTTISGIVRQAAEIWTEALAIRKQTLQVEGLAELPEVHADTNRMKQVFSNLIQNAIKYTPDGGTITVRGRLLAGDNGSSDRAVEVLVADTGIGIAPDDLDRVFEKFFRAGDALRHSTGDIKFKGGGPGLGLTITKGIVEAHGGRIWVESPGCDEQACPGSCFHIVLPLST